MPVTTEDGSSPSSLTHSRRFCRITAVRATGASVLSGPGLANKSLALIAGVVIPLKVGIVCMHLDTVLKAKVVRLT